MAQLTFIILFFCLFASQIVTGVRLSESDIFGICENNFQLIFSDCSSFFGVGTEFYYTVHDVESQMIFLVFNFSCFIQSVCFAGTIYIRLVKNFTVAFSYIFSVVQAYYLLQFLYNNFPYSKFDLILRLCIHYCVPCTICINNRSIILFFQLNFISFYVQHGFSLYELFIISVIFTREYISIL